MTSRTVGIDDRRHLVEVRRVDVTCDVQNEIIVESERPTVQRLKCDRFSSMLSLDFDLRDNDGEDSTTTIVFLHVREKKERTRTCCNFSMSMTIGNAPMTRSLSTAAVVHAEKDFSKFNSEGKGPSRRLTRPAALQIPQETISG